MGIFSQYKNSFLFGSFLAFCAICMLSAYNHDGWQKAKATIATRDNTINTLNEKIKGLDVIAQIERAQTIDAFNAKTQECANDIKRAIAGANVPPREKIVFKTQTKTQIINKEISNDAKCVDHVPDVIVTDAFGLRDIQNAGPNN